MSVMKGPNTAAVFFYGLFMDTDTLVTRGFSPREPRRAVLPGHALRIGRRATLVEHRGSSVYGVVTFMSSDEVERLYADPTVREYQPIPVNAEVDEGETVEAVAYVLPVPPADGERNPEYAAKLRDLCLRLKFPSTYVNSIR